MKKNKFFAVYEPNSILNSKNGNYVLYFGEQFKPVALMLDGVTGRNSKADLQNEYIDVMVKALNEHIKNKS